MQVIMTLVGHGAVGNLEPFSVIFFQLTFLPLSAHILHRGVQQTAVAGGHCFT